MSFVSPEWYVRDGYNFAPPTFGGAVACMYGSFAYTDTTAKTLFVLPAGAVVVDFYINITTLFNDTGTDLLTVGLGTDPDYFVDDADGSSAALIRAGGAATVLASRLLGAPLDGETAVTATFTGQNGNANQGAATFALFYILV